MLIIRILSKCFNLIILPYLFFVNPNIASASCLEIYSRLIFNYNCIKIRSKFYIKSSKQNEINSNYYYKIDYFLIFNYDLLI